MIEKYARAAASAARTPPNSPARRAALEAENTARVAAEHYVKGLEAERNKQAQRIADLEAKCDTLKRLHDTVADERDAAREVLRHVRYHAKRHDLDRACAACGSDYAGADELALRRGHVVDADKMVRPCRCGGCADSGCPGRGER